MAEPISLASGLLALVIFAHKSCVTLYTTIQSFKLIPNTLIGVLESLVETVKSDKDVDLSSLNLPMQRCGNACNEFLQELQTCCSRSGGDRTSFRDWAKLRYIGDNIDDFKDSLAAYKSTITIALIDVQVRKSSVTLERLGDYKELIETATNDLEARLETIDEKLEALIARTATRPESTELQRIKDERSSTQKCLLVCAQFSKLLDQLQPIPKSGSSRDASTIPDQITSDGIRECRISMEQTTAKLERHMQDILERMMSKAGTTMAQEDADYLGKLKGEWTAARQLQDICTKADRHLKENISVIDNHATGDDAVQFLVSNSQKTIHGKNRGYGDQIRQLGGHLSDQSIQKVSGDFLQMSLHRSENRASPARTDLPRDGSDLNEKGREWRPQYGSGRILKPEFQPNVMGGAESDKS
ncbi:hypothetical protein HBH98_053670 [Parastagonospora nodorum]|nr:hypothetical protein HBI10_147220 [Parastagonospora nodorum]KAH4019977.1 hypothetical protein HBI13_120370 [Parastagonospora nodorum]KAH4110257.1 hypothetical protein HBH46_021170 [Parastagonospora nodorum]KAH4162942.1 hypothetical protein HBH43_158580 [Parastagonospora nodorum]KAH4350767.1 hypothetical protein HBH98_053670 [Parastagonospora nodorum]